ncbi:MAG: hypothetical protein OIF50_13340, partial [Flavobacteriaceae bacterium]|nr:hypothetical protein [Flavobacteriaceae bacterium]
MKQGFLLLLCSFVLAPTYAKVKTNTDDCTNAQSNTSYVMSHAKRALKSDNFDHQTYYAERSLKAIEKTKGFLSNCNCNGASDPAYEATKSLKLAIDPKDWDEGRYYTKKAIEHIENLMIAMD